MVALLLLHNIQFCSETFIIFTYFKFFFKRSLLYIFFQEKLTLIPFFIFTLVFFSDSAGEAPEELKYWRFDQGAGGRLEIALAKMDVVVPREFPISAVRYQVVITRGRHKEP
jgi:hypothetical protein